MSACDSNMLDWFSQCVGLVFPTYWIGFPDVLDSHSQTLSGDILLYFPDILDSTFNPICRINICVKGVKTRCLNPIRWIDT